MAPETPETAELLQRLHPTAANPPAYPEAMGTACPGQRSWLSRPGQGQARRGLSPDTLRQGLAIHGGPFAEAVAAVAHRIAQGAVPPEVRPYFFGAQLAALEKKGGETLRRVAAHLLSWRVAAQVRPVLSAMGQVGVFSPGGLEAAVFGVRSFLAGPGASGVVVKIDASNAFNSISRAANGDAVARHSPPLLGGYFVAAYA